MKIVTKDGQAYVCDTLEPYPLHIILFAHKEGQIVGGIVCRDPKRSALRVHVVFDDVDEAKSLEPYIPKLRRTL